MLKSLTITALLSSSLFALDIEKKILKFEKHRIDRNPNIKLNNIELAFKKNVEDNWVGYVFKIDLEVEGKEISTNDIIFSNGKLISEDLKKLNGSSYKRMMHPTLDMRYYAEDHLIAGNKNAKHKLVLFSDPLCPICTEDTPEIIKDVQNNPELFALYYISFPLDMHPTAKTIAKAALVLREKNFKNADYKVYTAKLENHFDAYQNKNDEKSLNALNNVLGTKLTMNELNNSSIKDKIKYDMKLAEDAYINGTPTLFLDGEIDITRSNYKKYIK